MSGALWKSSSGPTAKVRVLRDTADTFPGQSKLQKVLEGCVELALGPERWLPSTEVLLSDDRRTRLAKGDYTVEFTDLQALSTAITDFAEESRISLNQIQMAIVIKSVRAGVAAVVERISVIDSTGAPQLPARVQLSLANNNEAYVEETGLPWMGNPLYSTEPTISLVLVARLGGNDDQTSQVRWDMSRLAECTWSPKNEQTRGGLFDIRELTEDTVAQYSLPGTPAYYVDVDGLSSASVDLGEVTVYVNPELFRLFRDDSAEQMDALFSAELGIEVVMAVASRLLHESRQSGEPAPLLQRIAAMAKVRADDPAEVDPQQLRAGLQLWMGLTGKTAAMWTQAAPRFIEDDYDDE